MDSILYETERGASPPVTLQINLAPYDYRHAVKLLPHQMTTFSPGVAEILLVYDCRKKRRKLPREWHDYDQRMRGFMAELALTEPRLRVTDVDYGPESLHAVAEMFFGRSSMPLYDFRGAPFYQYFFGLHAAAHDYVLHLDSDMFFGGGSGTWIGEAVAVMQREPDVLATCPLPGPPHPDATLVNQQYTVRETESRSYAFRTFSTRVFLIDRSRLQRQLRICAPSLIRCAWALVKGFPLVETVEDMISGYMQKNGLSRVDFLGSGNGIWSLHPLYRSESFYREIGDLLDRMRRMDIPEDQYGYYNFTESFIAKDGSFKAFK